MTNEHLTPSVEDYLKSIYELTLKDQRASTNEIARRMGIKAGSVTGMLKKLASSEPPLLSYHKHRGVALTPEGKRIALQVIRNHRLLESFLQETLGYAWDEVHEEADRLEHVISTEFLARIDRALGNPSHDPHGEPIPDQDLQVPSQSTLRLSDLEPEQRVCVERVGEPDSELLRYLESIGLVPGAQLDILERSSFDQNLRVQVGERDLVLGPPVTRRIFVKPIPSNS
jgi:DtxR family Mn-dependent transcriptional regulator